MQIGGVVGQIVANSRVNNSFVQNNVITIPSESSAVIQAGGLVGRSNGEVSNSYAKNNSIISLSSYNNQSVGGLVGFVNNDTQSKVTNSYAINNNVISTIRGQSGGLVGNNWGNIDNCFSKNNNVVFYSTSSYGNSGGLVGYAYSGVITNSYAQNNFVNSVGSSGYYGGAVIASGGLVGYNNDFSSISNSYTNNNKIKSSSLSSYNLAYSGGLVGSNDNSITNCYAEDNDISSSRASGGFVGYNYINIRNCYHNDIANDNNKGICNPDWFIMSNKLELLNSDLDTAAWEVMNLPYPTLISNKDSYISYSK